MSRFVVAIPACNEEAMLESCLHALADPVHAACDLVVLLLNNCTDGSLRVAEAFRRKRAIPVDIHVRYFQPSIASAGRARSIAMSIAAESAGSDGLVATTDADGVVAPDWVARNRAYLAAGSEVVCGRAVIDAIDARLICSQLHQDHAEEVAYGDLLDEIQALVDPDPDDPLPRHREESGASIACTADAYRRAGGIPCLASSEDRAFIAALRRVDARIRHARDVQVTVSGRLEGRAAGGMAETIARRMICQDALIDAALLPADDCLRHAELRSVARTLWNASRLGRADTTRWLSQLSQSAALPDAVLETLIHARFFGEFWSQLEAKSPVLIRRNVSRIDLAGQIGRASEIIASLRYRYEPYDRSCSSLETTALPL